MVGQSHRLIKSDRRDVEAELINWKKKGKNFITIARTLTRLLLCCLIYSVVTMYTIYSIYYSADDLLHLHGRQAPELSREA